MARTAHARRLCILIVDESIDAADALGAICEAAGHEVDFAYETASALDAARRLKPDVIFIEVALPREGGPALARELRADPDFSQTLIIALGAADRSAGFDEMLAMPVDPRLVLELLQKRAQHL